MIRLSLILALLLSYAPIPAFGTDRPGSIYRQIQDTVFRIMFYNVENLFDVSDDSLTDDDDFTPSGDLHWTWSKYNKKLNNISKVIIAAGQWKHPALVGLCEVENRKTLDDLLFRTPLSAFPYGVIHKESPDRRGIDVALLFDKDRLRVMETRFLPVIHHGMPTRDILYAKLSAGKAIFHVFVVHWPSRSEGRIESEPKRITAATVLKHFTDSLFNANSAARLLIMGDFNDDPEDKSIAEILQCTHNSDSVRLINLSSAPKKGNLQGTLKYQGKWNVFDQMMVSRNMLSCISGICCVDHCYTILNNPFLLEKDEQYTGLKPFRTYLGYRYLGGFSDHLPVFTDVVLRE